MSVVANSRSIDWLPGMEPIFSPTLYFPHAVDPVFQARLTPYDIDSIVDMVVV